MRGYMLYHTIHPDGKARGGTAILIKSSIKHYELQKYETSHLQATSVNIDDERGNLAISSVYCPPRHSNAQKQFEDFFNTLGERFIAGGDYNAKHTHWGSRLITTKGRELLRTANEHNMSFISTSNPTYWPSDPNKTPDLLDFFVVKGINENYMKVENCYELSSDHSPVILTISATFLKTNRQPSLTSRRTDWDLFREELEAKINLRIPLITSDQLDDAAEQFTMAIQQAAWAATPVVTERNSRESNYPIEVRKLIKEKRSARKRWHETRDPDDKTVVNRLSQQLKRLLQKTKNESFKSYLKNLSCSKESEYSLWKATKRLKRPKLHNPPIKKANNTWARDNKDKAEAFADHLEKTFQPDECPVDYETLHFKANEDTRKIQAISPKETMHMINKCMNPKKAPGYELITVRILKELPQKAINFVTYLFNAAIRLKYFPQSWKVAQIIMIPKPGKPENEIASYRPISLLPIISKLFERLILKRLIPIIEEKQHIPQHQFGFRNSHSTIDQVHRVTNVIEKAFEEGEFCPAVFLDVAQAFDKVWYEGLYYKLNLILPKDHYLLIKSYLTSRYFRIKIGDEFSSLKPISAGVPQGSVLGPMLYLLFTADIPKGKSTTMATFADDTAILSVNSCLAKATKNLQLALDDISEWTKKWRIKINELKSVHVTYTLRKIQYLPVTINQRVIPHNNSAKYLGMTLDARLTWKDHVRNKCTEIKLKQRKMYWLLGRNSQLAVDNKLLLYNQILKPIWTYGATLWGCAKEANRKKIQTIQNQILRSIVNAPWYIRNDVIHADLGISTVSRVIQKFAKNHEDHLHDHPNEEANQLLNNSDALRRLKRLKPYDLLT